MSFAEIYDFYLNPEHTPILVFAVFSFGLGMFLGRFLASGNILMVLVSLMVFSQFIYMLVVMTFEAPFHWGFFLTFQLPFTVGFLPSALGPVIKFIQRRI